MSFFIKTLIFGFMFFNYAPTSIYGYYEASKLKEEKFDLENGQYNWNLVNDNPDLKGISSEAVEYIEELRNLKSNDPEILGAYSWTVKKNKEEDLKQLRDSGFKDDVEYNKNMAKFIWEFSAAHYDETDEDVGSKYLLYLFEWLDKNKKSILEFKVPLDEQPVGIIEWVNKQYENKQESS